MDLKFMQELHNKEFATKESLAHRAGTIIAVLTTLGGVVAFVAVNAKPGDRPFDLAFWFLAAASGLALLTAAFYLVWSYRVAPLNDIARPKEWLTYWKGLKKRAGKEKSALAAAEAKFTEYLINQYAEIGDGNIDSNFKRGTRLVNSNNWLLAAFFLVVLTLLTFYVTTYIMPLPAQTQAEGAKSMIDHKDALICIPAAEVLNATGTNGPKPRPVPTPGPSPKPGG